MSGCTVSPRDAVSPLETLAYHAEDGRTGGFWRGFTFVRSRGNVGRTLLPGSQEEEEARRESLTGGVWMAPSTDGEFRLFGDGLPAVTNSGTSSIHSMEFYDGEIWALTGLSGVWRADLTEGRWTKAHEGLPIAGNDESAEPVVKLITTESELYAFGDNAVYVREASRWRRLTSDEFAVEIKADELKGGMVNLLSFDGELIAAASTGLYAIDPQAGKYRLVWQPNWPILTAKVLPSGLYVGLNGGGLWGYNATDGEFVSH
jgi:hypothetical protein